MPKPGVDPTSGISSGDGMIPIGIRHVGGAKHNQAFVWNVRSCSSMPREKPQAVPAARATVPKRRAGAEQPVVDAMSRTKAAVVFQQSPSSKLLLDVKEIPANASRN